MDVGMGAGNVQIPVVSTIKGAPYSNTLTDESPTTVPFLMQSKSSTPLAATEFSVGFGLTSNTFMKPPPLPAVQTGKQLIALLFDVDKQTYLDDPSVTNKPTVVESKEGTKRFKKMVVQYTYRGEAKTETLLLETDTTKPGYAKYTSTGDLGTSRTYETTADDKFITKTTGSTYPKKENIPVPHVANQEPTTLSEKDYLHLMWSKKLEEYSNQVGKTISVGNGLQQKILAVSQPTLDQNNDLVVTVTLQENGSTRHEELVWHTEQDGYAAFTQRGKESNQYITYSTGDNYLANDNTLPYYYGGSPTDGLILRRVNPAVGEKSAYSVSYVQIKTQ